MFVRVPERLTEYEWLNENGLNFRALLLWCHLFYNSSRDGDSWITFNELFRLVGASPSKRKKELKNDFIMAMERFKYDELINYKEDLTLVGMGDFVKVELKELFFKGKWNFVQLPFEDFKAISECDKEVSGDTVIAVYVYVLNNLLSDGWFYSSQNKISDCLHIRKVTVAKCLDLLRREKLLKRKIIKNPVTKQKQHLYAPKTKK